MQLRRRSSPQAEVPTASMPDVAFLLVIFFMVTATFAATRGLDLNLPPPGAQDIKQPKKPPYELRITLRKNMLVLSDNRLGLIKTIPVKGKEHNFAQLKQTLKQVKARLPNHTNITILAEQQTSYNDLIRAMDSSRSYRAQVDGEWVFAELFPDISIGDAAK